MRAARRLRQTAKVVGVALLLAAIAQEMSKPESERTWQGRVLGVPYDFRPPTWERLREAYWNPDEPRLFTDRPFGLGWAVNVGRIWVLANGLLESSRMPSPVRRAKGGLTRSAHGLQEVAAGLRETAGADS